MVERAGPVRSCPHLGETGYDITHDHGGDDERQGEELLTFVSVGGWEKSGDVLGGQAVHQGFITAVGFLEPIRERGRGLSCGGTSSYRCDLVLISGPHCLPLDQNLSEQTGLT